MAKIGRLDLAHSLKQLLELTGEFSPAIGEGIVPVISLASIEDSPFSLSIPFVRRVSAGPTIAEYARIHILVGLNAWVTIDKVMFIAAVAVNYVVEPATRAGLPALGSSATAVRARQYSPTRDMLPEVVIQHGTSTTVSTSDSSIIQSGVAGSIVLEGPWHLNQNGALVISNTATNQSIDCSIFGRLHFSAAR